jgi:putative NIF3 family GTP cyclohydrolase 1 type 2
MHANASLAEMVAWLDRHLDAARYREAEPDANGLILDTGEPGVTKFAVAVNTSLATIFGAAKAGAQLLVVHHSTWDHIDLHLRDEKLQALKLAGVSLYGAHASLDCAPQTGNGWVLAGLLGVRVDGTFREYHGGHAGVIGTCDGAFPGLIERISRELRAQVEAHEHTKTFGRIAIVPGGGGMTNDLDEARRLGADTYVTGEGSMFTRMFAKEAGMNLVLGTHYATEAPGIRALGERLSLEAGIPFEFIDESQDVF